MDDIRDAELLQATIAQAFPRMSREQLPPLRLLQMAVLNEQVCYYIFLCDDAGNLVDAASGLSPIDALYRLVAAQPHCFPETQQVADEE